MTKPDPLKPAVHSNSPARGRGEPLRQAPEARIPKPLATAPFEPIAGGSSPCAAGSWTPPRVVPLSPPPGPVSIEPFLADVAAQQDAPGYAASSRLDGIRNLLVKLGRRSLRDTVNATHATDLEPRFERATARPAFPDSYPAVGDEPTAAGFHSMQPTSQPEFLRPKPGLEVEKEKEPLCPTPPVPRRDSREAQEDIQTLPSWRGQYRKKRYPPI